jgi:hypothetical protein
MARLDADLKNRLRTAVARFRDDQGPLPGIADPKALETFLDQLVESVHRVGYVNAIRQRPLSIRRSDPNDELFDPIMAAVRSMESGERDEAFWLIFLFVHFGKHRRAGWKYIRDVYGRLGGRARWDWRSVSRSPAQFRAWLHQHQDALRHGRGGFGGHRKYESLNALSDGGTGAVVQSYVEWVCPPRTHDELIARTIAPSNGDPKQAFRLLFKSMSVVMRFGRTARFDYLAMIGGSSRDRT